MPDPAEPAWRALWRRLWAEPPEGRGTWLTRFYLLRLLGLIYAMAFATWVFQGPGLCGSRGLLPAAVYLDNIALNLGGRWAGFWEVPSVFWLADGDGFLFGMGWLGLGLSLVVLAGFANAILLLVLWALHLSITNVGQTFYAFGWEMQLLETGMLGVFLCPLLDPRPFPGRPVPLPIIWLCRWLIVRIMLGAGLIKLRGDACWRDLTCLSFHFETQPVPSPLSPLFHALPAWALKLGVAFNHFVELVVPYFVFAPRRIRHVAGFLLFSLQATLIASGNLSYLNWLTLVPILACFDDGFWVRLSPRRLLAAAQAARQRAHPARAQRIATTLFFGLVVFLSIDPVVNLFSSRQAMNRSFGRLQLVNTYGAFGSVGRERYEIELEATLAPTPDEQADWRPYLWKCKPGDPARRPCWMSPYHYRLDWLIWFAAMGEPGAYPWSVHLVARLLAAEPLVLDLLEAAPFGEKAPTFVRAVYYRYRLQPPGAPTWWKRERVGLWLPPLSREDPRLRDFLEAHGWAP